MVTDAESQLLRWIPLLPLLAAAVHGVILGLVRRPTPRWIVVGLSCGSVILAFAVSCAAFVELIGLPEGKRALIDGLYTWIGSGVGASERFSAEVAFRLDPLSSVLCLVVTGVGSLIHVYSIGYMEEDHRDDKGFQRFFCYLNLFTFSMLVLVLADNLVLMFLGWEGVGLCSYLLIGFWYSDRHNAYCGSKAFIVNRIGDFGFLIGIFLLFAAGVDAGTPSVAFTDIAGSFEAIAERTVAVPFWGSFWGSEWRLVDLIGLCLFLGACGKSAQLPLHVWLPDAMAGPTPVSALIHAATMVTAGVYLVCRLDFLYAAAPVASAVVAWVGVVTAFFAATVAIAQTDIKKVLAYSTLSQLGYMFLAAGCGGTVGAIFHLVTHAFFKALLFLGAGAVILAMSHEQDIEKMGGLRYRIWRTWLVFGVGVFAIAGFPPLSGFFSKDEILVTAYTATVPGHEWLYRIALLTAGLTSFYMFRLYFRTFWGECRAPVEVRDRIREPSGSMLIPLYALAALALFGGLFGVPQLYGDWLSISDSHSLENFLGPILAATEPHALDHGTEAMLAGMAIGMAVLGALAAWWLYVRQPGLPARIAAAFSTFHSALREKYWVDEIYDALVVRPLVRFSDAVLYRVIDAGVIDGLAVNGTARSIRALAEGGLKHLQSGLPQTYVFTMIAGTVAILAYLLA